MSCITGDGPSADDIEMYSLGRMSTAAAADVEEHLLACAHCREELSLADRYVALLRAAARELLSHENTAAPLADGLTAALAQCDAHLIAMHNTTDGLMLLYVCPSLSGGKWLARVVGGTVDAGSWAFTRRAAVHECHRTFAELYSEHVCNAECIVNVD
jgi:anti-sigma factor RsiW